MKSLKRQSPYIAIITLALSTSLAAAQVDTPSNSRVLPDDDVSWSSDTDNISNISVNTPSTALWQAEEFESQIKRTPALDKIFTVPDNVNDAAGKSGQYATSAEKVSGGISISGWMLIALISVGVANILSKKSKK